MIDFKDKLYIATFQHKAVEVAANYGLGLEYNHTCISEALDPDKRDKLLAAMKNDFEKAGHKDAILHGPFTEIHPAAIDYRARQMAMERIEEAYQVCEALGVKKMVVHTGWMPFIYFKEWQAQKGADFWQKFMSDKPADFTICVENVLDDEPYMLLDMMNRIDDPSIKLCLDIGHAHAVTSDDIPVETWIKELGPHIGHFHLHNNFGDGDTHGDFENGSMDMDSIFKAIEDYCSCDVTYTIEARECENCVKWLKEHKYI